MKCRSRCTSAFVALLVALLAVSPSASALEESERLWLVGERAYADKLYAVSRRALERFMSQFPADRRVPAAALMLGRARLALGDLPAALEAFRRAQTASSASGAPLEARFWEAEVLFRLKRYPEARVAYDDVVRQNAASPFAADAVYGLAWSELESKRPEAAVAAFRDFLSAWPEHAFAPSATLHLARALVDLKRTDEALPLLAGFAARYPAAPQRADAQYLLGWLKATTGDARGGLADLRAFVAAHPSHDQAPAARRLITQTAARYGDREELLDSYKTLMEQEPATPEGLNEAAGIAARLGRPPDQEAAWRKLRAQFPEHALTRRLALDLAASAFKQKNWKDAATFAQVAAESNETTLKSEGWLLTGESELKLKRFAPAAKAFEAVGAIPDVEADVRFRALAGLGLAREEQKEWKAALAAYDTVVKKSPDATLRDWARQRMTEVKARASATTPAPKPKPGTRS
jgi:TolA-binding protein